MKLALSNKKEGTELFQGGNYKHAAARYNKALTHACKFFDVSPQQQAEVDATKLGLHLNIAQCWLKIGEGAWVEQVVRSCRDALAIDADCVKALYRRATALESKGDYEWPRPTSRAPPSSRPRQGGRQAGARRRADQAAGAEGEEDVLEDVY